MQKKKRKGRVLLWIFLLVVSVLNLIVLLLRDDLIIYLGISAYRIIQITAVSLEAVLAVIILAVTLKGVAGQKDTGNNEQRDEKAPVLSAKEKLDNSSLQTLLAAKSGGEWKSLAPELYKTISQLQMMDSYQERLHSLLRENDLKALSDTEDILDQAEQHMCQNVRKILNYMNVLDGNDVEIVRASVEKANTKNQEQLTQVRDFIVAVTDFVNQQGYADQDPDLLNTYKTMILESIKEEV